MPDDLVRKEYWDSVWASEHSPDAIEPAGTDLRNHLNREFDRLFCEVLSDTDTADAPALEIGR